MSIEEQLRKGGERLALFPRRFCQNEGTVLAMVQELKIPWNLRPIDIIILTKKSAQLRIDAFAHNPVTSRG